MGGAIETVSISGETLTVEGCGTSCTMTVNKAPTMEVHTTTAGNGTVTWKTFELTANCTGFTCKYGGNSESGITLTGGNPAVLTASKAPFPVTGGAGEFFCGKTGEWDAVYEITTPKPLFIV